MSSILAKQRFVTACILSKLCSLNKKMRKVSHVISNWCWRGGALEQSLDWSVIQSNCKLGASIWKFPKFNRSNFSLTAVVFICSWTFYKPFKLNIKLSQIKNGRPWATVDGPKWKWLVRWGWTERPKLFKVDGQQFNLTVSKMNGL